ncbi:MAG: iron-containing alcohol dehydrogenase [Sphingobacterium sp.]
MKDFYFTNQTKILFGTGKITSLIDELPNYGGPILLVYGENSIKKNGAYQVIVNSIKELGFDFSELSGVPSNPTLNIVREGINLAKKNKIQTVISVGGGSAIDAAKAIAAGSLVDHDVWDFFNSDKRPKVALPIIAVPTVAASGSEINGGTVITNQDTKEKIGIGSPCLNPKVAILDPYLTLSLPMDYTIYGIVDMFSHVFEPYFNGEVISLEIQDNLAEALMLSIINISKQFLVDPQNVENRADLLWASTLSFYPLLFVGRGKITFEVHIIAHAIGGLYNIPHGAAIAVIIPAWVKLKGKKDEMFLKKAARFSQKCFKNENINDTSDGNDIFELITRWFSQLGLPTSLKVFDVDKSECDSILLNIDRSQKGLLKNRLSDNDLEIIVRNLF